MNATILRGVIIDWLALRRALKALRETTGLKPAAFARTIQVHKATVPRVEDLDGRPTYKPDLETIARWIQATEPIQVSAFIARFEAELPNVVLNDRAERTQNPPDPVEPPEADHGAGLSASTAAALALDHLIAAIVHLSTDLADVAARAEADRSRASPRAPEPPRRPDVDQVG
jgi:hypothetical protein